MESLVISAIAMYSADEVVDGRCRERTPLAQPLNVDRFQDTHSQHIDSAGQAKGDVGFLKRLGRLDQGPIRYHAKLGSDWPAYHSAFSP